MFENRSIDVVIVSYNCKDSLIQCLESLEECRGAFDLRTIVVDNASSDETPDEIQLLFPLVTVIPGRENLGFSSGCNIGIAAGRAEFILLLNPDCVLDARDLQRLLECLRQDTKAACAAPQLMKGGQPSAPVYRAVVTLREFFAKMLFLDRVLVARADKALETPDASSVTNS
ncbi:MAG: glycosyltransferase, partial [Candidatus Coatesbacteria bacterium]|nr:glycosyltransferase [Candidatus Coatesbacteria bacterium]